jgi:uncharacterized repeat protein (TIGR01451 family)
MRYALVKWLWAVLFLFFPGSIAYAQNDPDLPGVQPNIETIRAGSLIIPMDNTLQALNGTPFNMKAYGLVNALLHSNVPVKWAIATGKAKDGFDFRADATAILPTAGKVGVVGFKGGPFIVERAFTNNAMSIIKSWSNNVAVYQLASDTAIDIRYTLAHKPKVAVMADGAFHYIQTNALVEAGFPASDFQVLFATNLPLVGTTSCFTIVTAPHYDGGPLANDQTLAIRGFLQSGGNVLCQCAAVTTYENNTNGFFHTTAGISGFSYSGSCSFTNADSPYIQFEGGLTNLVAYSALSSWFQRAGSSLTNSAYPTVFVNAPNTPYCAVSKLRPGQPGTCMFYLGGHDYGVGSTIECYNGRRMMLNAVFVPADRPSECGVNFQTDLAVTQNIAVRSLTNDQQVTYTITVTNNGPARVVGAPFSDFFPATVSNVLWSASFAGKASASVTNGAGDINALLNMAVHEAVVFSVTGTLKNANACLLTNTATVSTPVGVLEADSSNNTSSHIDNVANAVRLADVITCLGGSAQFTANASGPGPLQFVWKKDGATLANTDSALQIASVSASDAGHYVVEVTGPCSSATNAAMLYVGDLMTSTVLGNVVACPNQAVVFSTAISNFPYANYVWRKNGGVIAGATNSSLTINVAGAKDTGTYAVEVSNSCITRTNSATLYVPSTSATAIFSATRCPGQPATFTTLATGDGPYAFVWRKDGVLLDGQTTSSLSIASVTTSNSGLYSVEVSGPCNTVTNSATLTVRTNAAIASLGTTFACPGQAVNLVAVPTGTGPFSYRWRKNAILMSGQTKSNLVLSAVTTNDSGTYTVEVSGPCTGATNFGVLAVGTSTATSALGNQSRCPHETAVFTTHPIGPGPFGFVWRRDGDVLIGETNNTLSIPDLPAGMPPATITVEVYGACGSTTNSGILTVEDYITVTNSITFTNGTPITIVDNQPASVYPSTIHVGCIWPEDVTKVQVGLYGLSHSYPSDVCVLLQAPTGKTTALMVDAGGGRTNPVYDVDLLFDDTVDTALPYQDFLTTGVFRPTVYGADVSFPNPSPIYTNVSLTQFCHDSPHGDWNLFIFDNRIIDSGLIARGWSLTLFVADPHAPRFVGAMTNDAGMFCTTLKGDADHPHVIQCSTNLVDWTSIATNDLPNGSFLFSNLPPSTLLFYRAVRLP